MWSKKWSFRIGRSTVYKIIPETCNAIITALQPPIYLPPMTREDWRNVADGFYEKWNFPNCIGAVDGKHIRIQALYFLTIKNSFLFLWQAVMLIMFLNGWTLVIMVRITSA